MIRLTIERISELIEAEIYNYKDIEIEGVSRDSRDIEDNMLYIPLKGGNNDGHDYINDVIKKGIKATIWNKEIKPYPNITCILVNDTKEAMQKLAKEYLNLIACKVVAITGSNGKTSIKDMMFSVIREKYKVSKTILNYNNEIGVPLSILNANIDDDFLVLEMGMDKLGDIEFLTKIAKPDYAIISNIGSAHLEYLKTRENIAIAKLEIIKNLDGGLFIKNGMEPLLDVNYENSLTFGNSSVYDIYPKNIQLNINGLYFDTNLIDNIHIKTYGIAQVENAMAVILLAKKIGMTDEEIRKGLEKVEFTGKRNLIYNHGENLIFDDSYKSNPEGLYKAFETMSYFEKKKIAVLSDMLELGENERKFHEEVAYKIAEYNIDKVYLYGDLSKYTYEKALLLGIEAKYYDNKYDIVKDLLNEKNSIILFKASNSMKIFDLIEQYKMI